MVRKYLLRGSLIFFLAISGCAIDLSQPRVETNTVTAPSPTTTQVSLSWASLDLTGKLVYSMGSIDQENHYRVNIQVLDLPTGETTTIYTTPIDAWVYYVSVSPDAERVMMSFSPPPQSDAKIVQALYILPLDGSSSPELLFMPQTREDQYIQAEWSPDGKHIYYTHVNYQFPETVDRVYPLYTIYRRVYPGGEEELVAEGAYWPRLSADSRRLVYIGVDPLSSQNRLMIADPDGGNAREVMISGPYVPEIKDAPIFSPDGESILFSGVVPVPPSSSRQNWFENIMGVRLAKANGNVPSDWWSVPVDGGEITQLTHLQTTGLYGSLAPDQRYVASTSFGGIFVMKPDGSEVTLVVSNLDGFSGTVDWIP